MPTILGIPLIGFIQMVIGAAVVMFVLIKYLIGPYCLVGIAVSTVLYYANKFRAIS